MLIRHWCGCYYLPLSADSKGFLSPSCGLWIPSVRWVRIPKDFFFNLLFILLLITLHQYPEPKNLQKAVEEDKITKKKSVN